VRFGLATWGSTGDIRPFLALAGGLAAAGHEVRLVVADVFGGDYRAHAAAAGFSVAHADVALDAEFMDGLGQRMLGARNALLQFRLIYREMLRPAATALGAAARGLAKDCDVIVRHDVLHGVQAASLGANN